MSKWFESVEIEKFPRFFTEALWKFVELWPPVPTSRPSTGATLSHLVTLVFSDAPCGPGSLPFVWLNALQPQCQLLSCESIGCFSRIPFFLHSFLHSFHSSSLRFTSFCFQLISFSILRKLIKLSRVRWLETILQRSTDFSSKCL